MLSLRPLAISQLACRRCSFSSVLTFGKTQQTSDDKNDHVGDKGDNYCERTQVGLEKRQSRVDKDKGLTIGSNAFNKHYSTPWATVDSPTRLKGNSIRSTDEEFPVQDGGSWKSFVHTEGKWHQEMSGKEYVKSRVSPKWKGKESDEDSGSWKSWNKEWYRAEDQQKNLWSKSTARQNRKKGQWPGKSKVTTKLAASWNKGYVKTAHRDLQENCDSYKVLHDNHQDERPDQNSGIQPSNKPRGKRQRKKDKLGFIESEEFDHADADQLLYGLHPVHLALTAGLRAIRRIYHRRGSVGDRLARLLETCSARGIVTVPLSAAQLDAIAQGTGVHQGVCALVSPLRQRPVAELLAALGYPPLEAVFDADGEERAAPAADGRQREAESEDEAAAAAAAAPELRPPGARSASEDGRSVPVADECPAPKERRPTPENAAGALRGPCPTAGAEGLALGGLPSQTEELPPQERSSARRRVWVLLDRVQDPMNLGSILRSCYFLGVDAVIVPDRDSCPLSPTVSKASAGVLEIFPTYSVPASGCRELLQLLRQRRWQLLAAGACSGSSVPPSSSVCPLSDTLLVVGNEGAGVTPELAQLCRPLTIPPQRHLADGVESLNVGVATGILLSQLTLSRP